MAGRVVVSTLNNDTGVLATQNGMTGIAKAWCNFDGTLSGTITPRASFNIGSVTKNGTGDYTVNFTTAMPNANYSVVGIVGYAAAVATDSSRNITGKTWTTTGFRFVNQVVGGVALDYEFQQVSVFSS